MAYEYAKRGAYLALVARREHRLREVAEVAEILGSPFALVIHADVSKVDDCKRCVQTTLAHFGRCKFNIKKFVTHFYFLLNICFCVSAFFGAKMYLKMENENLMNEHDEETSISSLEI